LKILHVSPAFFPATYWGGPIFSVASLCRALASNGTELRVLTTDSAGPSASDRIDPAAQRSYPLGHGVAISYCRRLAGVSVSPGLLARLLPLVTWADLVHLTGTYSFPTIPTLLACRLLRKPLVWSPRGALQATQEWAGATNRPAKRLWEQVCSSILGNARCTLHVTSVEEEKASLARVRVRMAKVIRNGVEVPAALAPRPWTPDGRLRLLFLGRLDPKKGIENLLHALASLRDPSISLSICGTGDPGYVSHLERLAASLPVAPRTRFHGHVDGERKTDAFATADICVAPSHNENFCMVVAESLAHAVPVIASTGTPWARLAERGCGRWVDNSPESLARAIAEMRKERLAEMGSRGRKWMQEEFGWDAVAREMRELYRALIDGA
jgi:glycosyltransferase involved in cell wall biosynthesis